MVKQRPIRKQPVPRPAEQLAYAVGKSSLGPVLVAATRRGVRAVTFGASHAALGRNLRRQYPHARLAGVNPALHRLVNRVIRLVNSPASPTGLPLDVQGTPFQKKVWNALRRIPAGSTSTYAGIARKIGKPRAVRAVAGACGENPVAVAIPCHRVIGSSGALTGYRWGLHRKRALLERERGAAQAVSGGTSPARR